MTGTTLRRTALAMAAAAGLAGCSALDAINPFSSSTPKVVPAPLATFQATAELTPAWQASVGPAGNSVLTPAVVGETVYAAAQDGTLVRYDGGRQAWRISAGQAVSGGVGADAKLVVVGTAKGEVLAFRADTGAPAWKAQVSSEVLAAPTVGDGLVAVRAGDSHIYAFDAASGARRWIYQRTIPALALRSNVGVTLWPGRGLVAGFPGGKLVAISQANGAALWEGTVAQPKGATELERVTDVTSAPVINGGEVCAAAYQGRVSCFDLNNGNLLWSRELSSSAGLDLDNRYVYVSEDPGAVQAFDRSSGASIWKQDKLANRGLSRPLALGDLIAVADAEGYVHLLRRDNGAFAARQATDGSAIAAEPQRLGAGLVAQTKRGGLFALLAR